MIFCQKWWLRIEQHVRFRSFAVFSSARKPQPGLIVLAENLLIVGEKYWIIHLLYNTYSSSASETVEFAKIFFKKVFCNM